MKPCKGDMLVARYVSTGLKWYLFLSAVGTRPFHEVFIYPPTGGEIAEVREGNANRTAHQEGPKRNDLVWGVVMQASDKACSSWRSSFGVSYLESTGGEIAEVREGNAYCAAHQKRPKPDQKKSPTIPMNTGDLKR
ncbi:MAG: hypothetical protein AAF598_07325 [Bacteroidota bacterium]